MQKNNPFRFIKVIKDKLFGGRLEFRVRLFNILASFGVLVSLVSAASSFFIWDNPAEYGSYLLYCLISLALIIYNVKTGRYQHCYMIAIVLVFFIGFPVFFFVGGVYYSAMPYFFVFAVLFTIFMLEGKLAIVVSVLELVLYVSICAYAFLFVPVKPEYLEAGRGLFETVFGFSLVSVSLGVCLFAHLRLYNRQQRELEKANEQLRRLNSMKTDFLQDINHEIKNPLYVISLGIDLANTYIGTKDKKEEVSAALATAQNEALRLGRMISGMVELATMSGNPMSRDKADFAAILRNCAETSRLQVEKMNNKLNVNIAPDLPPVYVETEQLERVLINLLTNALECTRDGEITLEAFTENNYITVRVRDTGEGVPPEIMPRIFERGVSGKGGKGYGLSICRTIVEAYGGKIEIESAKGGGTAVTFTISVYSGQNEAREDGQ